MLSSEASTASTNKLQQSRYQITLTSLDTALHGTDVSSSTIRTKKCTTSQRSKKQRVRKASWMAKPRSIVSQPPSPEPVSQTSPLLMYFSATFHAGLKSFNNYLSSLQSPTDLKPTQLLSIMDSFSQPLHSHLASEPQAILALSRFASPERQFDLIKIEQEEGKKAVNADFAINVLPIFLNNMETVEFEGGMWRKNSEPPSFLKDLIPRWNMRQWRFTACDGQGRRKQLVA